MLWLLVLATAGCDSPSSRPSSSGAQPRVEKLKTNFNIDDARQLAEPISNTEGLSVNTTAAQNMAIGNEVFNGQMEPAKGLQTKRLFDTPTSDDDERFERLEAAMQKMRDDFDAVSPSINRLIAIEREIQTLVDQLNILVDNGGAVDATAGVPPVSAAMIDDDATAPSPGTPIPLGPPLGAPPVVNEDPAPTAAPPPVPMPKAPAPPVVAATPPAPHAATTDGPVLIAARVADHEKTTRIVFETTKEMAYSASVDPENILLVTFTKGTSKTDLSEVKMNSKLIKSMDATAQGGGGVIVAMPLSKSSKVVGQGVLKPDAENTHYRIYIDLSK